MTGIAYLAPTVGRSVFGDDAPGYHRARPGYPDALYALIAERIAAHPAIVEIGPGTGLATVGLTSGGVAGIEPRRYVAVEPDAQLTAFLADRFRAIEIVTDDFCAIEGDGQFDLVASASSFHWLDAGVALERARGWLRPGGTIALWWNVYRQVGIGDAFADAVAPLLAELALPPSEAAHGHVALDAERWQQRLADAGFVAIEHRVLRRERTLTPDEARDLYASFSLARVLPEDERTTLLDAIAAIVRTRFAGSAPSILLTPLYLARASA